MGWKATFNKGVACLEHGDLEQALAYINQAAELEDSNFIIYDTRAAVHEKLGNVEAALLDSRRVTEVAPERWQGYARSATLLDLLGKHGHVIKMVDHALSRLQPEDAQQRIQLVEMREKAAVVRAAVFQQRLSQGVQTTYHDLPVETFVEIFSLLIKEDHTWAVKLSHVCGYWRRILINTPSAWQTLVLSRKHPLRKAKLWKERSKRRISHISVDIPELDISSVLAALRDLYWNSLSSLCISSVAFVELHQILSDTIDIPHAFANLDELILDCHTPDPLSRFLSSPMWQLRVLRLAGNISLVDKWWQRIQRLQEIRLSGILYNFSPMVLIANPSLETFVLNCTKMSLSDSAGPASATSTSMNSLKTIKVAGVGNPLDILRGISTPSISHFSLASAVVADEIIFQIASRPSLVELHIVGCYLLSLTLPVLLSSTPNLEILQVSNTRGVVNDLLKFLSPVVSQSVYGLPCRALKHVDVSHTPDLMTSIVRGFVQIRAHHSSESARSEERCATIVSLKLDGCLDIDTDMLPWFRSHVAQFSYA